MNRFELWVVEQLETPQRRVRWMLVAYACSFGMLILGVFVILTTLLG